MAPSIKPRDLLEALFSIVAGFFRALRAAKRATQLGILPLRFTLSLNFANFASASSTTTGQTDRIATTAS